MTVDWAVIGQEAPVPLGRFRLNAVASKAAMLDEGLAWLFALLVRSSGKNPGSAGKSQASAGKWK